MQDCAEQPGKKKISVQGQSGMEEKIKDKLMYVLLSLYIKLQLHIFF